MPLEWEEELLRIAQESLTNTIKHANASLFEAVLDFELDQIRLRLADNGRGFNPSVEHEGLGLIGMKERVDRMGGRFFLRTQPGRGTEISILLRHPKE
jgi:signal transduction histidine kinase